jgi:TolB protein
MDGEYEVFVIGPDGVSQLTSGTTSFNSVISRDGRIAFVSRRDGNDEIYVMNADGSGQTNLTGDPSRDERPTWSPNGQRIAFQSTRDGDFELFLMNADGSGVTQLTDNEFWDGQPRWSQSDPNLIVFSSDRTGNPEIFVLDISTGTETQLTGVGGPVGAAGRNTMPTWSPDGASIAFVSNRHGSPGEVYVMASDGTNPTRVTQGGGFRPSWSADGQWIVFNANRDEWEGNELYLVSPIGSGLMRIPWTPSESLSASWHPNPPGR